MQDDLEVLREPDVAGVQHDKTVHEAVLARERVVTRARPHRGAVGPVVNHGDLRRVRALPLDEPPLHRVAERDDPCGLPHEKSIHLGQRVVDDAAAKILEEHGDFRKDVLAQKHERHTRPGGCRKRGETDDRRIGQRHHDVGPPDALSLEDGRLMTAEAK